MVTNAPLTFNKESAATYQYMYSKYNSHLLSGNLLRSRHPRPVGFTKIESLPVEVKKGGCTRERESWVCWLLKASLRRDFIRGPEDEKKAPIDCKMEPIGRIGKHSIETFIKPSAGIKFSELNFRKYKPSCVLPNNVKVVSNSFPVAIMMSRTHCGLTPR